MKKYVVLWVMLCVGFSVTAQDVVSDFQRKYVNGEDFTVVNISAKMFQMMVPVVDPEMEQMVKDLTGMKVLTSNKNAAKYYQEAIGFINRPNSGYEELMSVQEKNENIVMFTKELNGIITELIVIVGGKSDFVLMGFTGKIDLKRIATLSKSMNVNGLMYLDKIK